MGAASTALALAALLAIAPQVHAESCTGTTPSGGRFATCFDLGNRLSIVAGTGGFGGSIALRHEIHFDDEPDLVWKLEHTLLESTHAGFSNRFTGVLYRGRFLRHARDGHIVIPLGTPKKVFLPFDIGAMTEVGAVSWRPDATARIGVVKMAALIDFSRSRSSRQRFAIGPVARWDVELDRDPLMLVEHVVSPFTSGAIDLHLESVSGLLVGDLRIEAGTAWRTTTGWKPQALVEASVERIVLAVNDRPIALVLGARYESATDEATAGIAARIVLFHRADPRVSLHPPGASR